MYQIVLFRMTLSDLAKYSIFSDMRHRAASLRQLSLLYIRKCTGMACRVSAEWLWLRWRYWCKTYVSVRSGCDDATDVRLTCTAAGRVWKVILDAGMACRVSAEWLLWRYWCKTYVYSGRTRLEGDAGCRVWQPCIHDHGGARRVTVSDDTAARRAVWWCLAVCRSAQASSFRRQGTSTYLLITRLSVYATVLYSRCSCR